MLQTSTEFMAEVDELHALLQTLAPEDWLRETTFKRWTPWDVVAHLHYFDGKSLLALEGEERFAPERKALFSAIAGGRKSQQLAREALGGLDCATLESRWHTTARALAERLGHSDPKRRLPWYGPDMGVQMFATARSMECWAHGQEIYDLLGVSRTYSDRIKSIATIGIKTFGWTFVNRKLEVPAAQPYVRLVAPSGAIWEWNEPSERECIHGAAAEFCHVVTQGRNIADTRLEVTGPVATRWMSIAQCFAGGPEDPPKPGARGPQR